MEIKKNNHLYSGLFLFIVVASISVGFLPIQNLPPYANILIAQGIIIIPVLIFAFVNKEKFIEQVPLKPVRPLSILLLVPLLITMYPIIIFVNVLSLLFSTNEIAGVMTSVVDMMPYIAGVSLMALLPATVEEITFRGVLFHGYRKQTAWYAILISGVTFGLMHMNLNQFMYATVMGIIFALVVEATGSIVPTIIMHFCFNGFSVSLLYGMEYLMNYLQKYFEANPNAQQELGMSQQEMEQMMNMSNVATEQLGSAYFLLMAAMFILPAIGGIALSSLLIYWLARLNHREEYIVALLPKKLQNKLSKKDLKTDDRTGAEEDTDVHEDEGQKSTHKGSRFISPLWIIAAVICLGYCIMLLFL